jgi:glycosyltransferase involved in cell wall biosynthesis
MIKVLWLIKGLGPGGAERLLLLSAPHVDPERYSVQVAYVLAWKRALVAALRGTGLPVHCLGGNRSWDPRWILRLRRLLRTEAFDVVHVHSPLAAIGARVAIRTLPRGRRPKMLTTEHNVWHSYAPLTARVHALTAPADDARLAVSAAVRDSMPARLHAGSEVVLHGIDLDAVRAQLGERAVVRGELGIAPEEIVVGTVANLRANKAYPDLLHAARLVLDRRPAVRFVAIGQGPDERAIATLHRELALGERFQLLGYREDAVRVMSGFDIFCLPSRHEGLPVAVMEAIALGLPVVATAVGGVPELVRDGCEAVLLEPGEPERLAGALIELVDDPPRREAMARAARERSHDFALDRSVRRVAAIYDRLAATRVGHRPA